MRLYGMNFHRESLVEVHASLVEFANHHRIFALV